MTKVPTYFNLEILDKAKEFNISNDYLIVHFENFRLSYKRSLKDWGILIQVFQLTPDDDSIAIHYEVILGEEIFSHPLVNLWSEVSDRLFNLREAKGEIRVETALRSVEEILE